MRELTKAELSQLTQLQGEMEDIKKRIEKIVNLVNPSIITDFVKGSSSRFPYTEHSVKIQDVDFKECDKLTKELRNLYKEKLDELTKLIAKTFEYIHSLPGSEMRRILSLRYIDRFTWEQIGNIMHYATITVETKHRKFMKDNIC